MSDTSDILVIGGGIVGASAAYALARRGVRVTLVDRADDGQATAAGAGILSPATSLKSPAAFFPLAFRAVAYYPELLAALAEDGERDTGHEVAGLLHIAMDDDEAARLHEVMALFQRRAAEGAPNLGDIAVLDGDQARLRFPALSPKVRAAIATSGGARVDGRRLRDALLRAAARRGAAIVRRDALPLVEVGRLSGVRVDGQTLAASAVLLAGGAWSAAFLARLGLALPVYPQRGQILHLELPASETSHWPIVVGFHSYYLLTFPTHRVVAGATREDTAGFDVRMTAAGVHEALGEALRVAPGLGQATLCEVRVGLRPANPDGLPMLGRLPAAGMGASGLQLGPYCGALVADLALGATSPIDLAPYAPDRIAHNPG